MIILPIEAGITRMKMLSMLLLLVPLSIFGSGTVDDPLVSVVARGMGVTAEAALKDSFRDAVERAVGVFVDAEQQAKNDQLISDRILTQSNAYIENYRKISERKGENGLFEVKIVAKVKKAQLTRKLKDTMPTKTFSLGDDLKREYGERQKLKVEFEKQAKIDAERKRQEAAKEVSKEKRDADAAALVKNTFADFNPTAMMIDVTATGGKPVVEEKNGEMTVGFDLCLRLSTEKYFETLLPRLKQLFGQIALEKPRSVSFLLKRPKEGMRSPLGGVFVEPVPAESAMLPLDSLWDREIEIGGTVRVLPNCRFLKNAVLGFDPMVWLVENIKGNGQQVRVTMNGYVLPEKCIETLREISKEWDGLRSVKFVVDLLDASGEVVTERKFRVRQELGWIGWDRNLELKHGYVFYVMPWMSLSLNVVALFERDGLFYDAAGNCLGRMTKSLRETSMPLLVEAVPFKCAFKVLEDELKSISSIRVRVAE